jgi:hypothetical protein
VSVALVSHLHEPEQRVDVLLGVLGVLLLAPAPNSHRSSRLLFRCTLLSSRLGSSPLWHGGVEVAVVFLLASARHRERRVGLLRPCTRVGKTRRGASVGVQDTGASRASQRGMFARGATRAATAPRKARFLSALKKASHERGEAFCSRVFFSRMESPLRRSPAAAATVARGGARPGYAYLLCV